MQGIDHIAANALVIVLIVLESFEVPVLRSEFIQTILRTYPENAIAALCDGSNIVTADGTLDLGIRLIDVKVPLCVSKRFKPPALVPTQSLAWLS